MTPLSLTQGSTAGRSVSSLRREWPESDRFKAAAAHCRILQFRCQ